MQKNDSKARQAANPIQGGIVDGISRALLLYDHGISQFSNNTSLGLSFQFFYSKAPRLLASLFSLLHVMCVMKSCGDTKS